MYIHELQKNEMEIHKLVSTFPISDALCGIIASQRIFTDFQYLFHSNALCIEIDLKVR